jgi:hypothetical protein
MFRAQLVRTRTSTPKNRLIALEAIARTTPVLLGLLSLVTLVANCLHARGLLVAQTSSWYHKPHLTFSDALAVVRRYLWTESLFSRSAHDEVIVTLNLFNIWPQALAWAA